VHLIAEMIDDKLNRDKGTTAALIEFVEDRPGHDVRYAIDASKIENELGFSPSQNFEEKLKETIDWYLTNPQWIKDVVSGEYRRFYELNYGNT
jgi:dTDP-glucose 4,6-dehydratase